MGESTGTAFAVDVAVIEEVGGMRKSKSRTRPSNHPDTIICSRFPGKLGGGPVIPYTAEAGDRLAHSDALTLVRAADGIWLNPST